MRALVGAFNQEKALLGAFSVIVKSSHNHLPSHDCLTVDHGCGEVRGRGGPAEGVVGAAGGGHARGQLGPGGGEAKQSS